MNSFEGNYILTRFSFVFVLIFFSTRLFSNFKGYGTDAIIYLKVMSSEANELLPV